MSPAWALCRDARRQAGLSQRQLAERASVSPSTVARIEKGRMEPTLDLLLRLVRACRLDLRMRLALDDGSGTRRSSLPIEDRLRENDRLSHLWVEVHGRT